MATKPFWTSFFDGFTGEGIFGDLRLPGAPTRMFISEEEAAAEVLPESRPILVVLAEAGVVMQADELTDIRAAVQRAVDETLKGNKVKVAITDAATGTERHVAG